MVQSRGGEPAFPDSAFSSGRCSFPGQVEQGLCVTPAKLLLFPEVVFKAEKESGQGPCFSQWLAGRFVQETADCTLCDNHSSISLSLPFPFFSLLPFPFSLPLTNGSPFCVVENRAMDQRPNTTRTSVPRRPSLRRTTARRGRALPWHHRGNLWKHFNKSACSFRPKKCMCNRSLP